MLQLMLQVCRKVTVTKLLLLELQNTGKLTITKLAHSISYESKIQVYTARFPTTAQIKYNQTTA